MSYSLLYGFGMSKVYLFRTDKNSFDFNKDVNRLADVFLDYLEPEDEVAIKLHFGERNSETHLSPDLVESIYSEVDDNVEKTVLMDCNVLYNSERSLGSSHRNLAKDNGFDFAPIEIADGEKSRDEMVVPIDLNHFDRAKLGKALGNYSFLFVLSHFTGHNPAGFGGALKNIGMGLGTREGKMEMHQVFNLNISSSDCIACGKCVQECPVDAISISEDSAVIDQEKCIGCGMCIAICPKDAVEVPWEDGSARKLDERLVEYAYAALKDRRSYFVSVLMDITPDCDCINEKQEPLMNDVGILLSDDIVSIDQAGLDLSDTDKFDGDTDPEIQVRYAEKLGMGERDYELVEI